MKHEIIIKKAEFAACNVDVRKCQRASIPEYVFIGRSNVGKSTLINLVTNNGSLARISSKPGKTQTINHYLVNESWYLVDLPGYGFAKAGKDMRKRWNKMIIDYLLKRENLACVFLLLDSRLEPQANDVRLMGFLAQKRIPFVMVFTKIDKLSSSAFNKNLLHYKREMLKTWESLPDIFVTSAVTRLGREQLLTFIEATNGVFAQYMKNRKVVDHEMDSDEDLDEFINA